MARSARKIGSLLEEEPELADALGVVVERSDGGETEIEWGDVSDDLTSGQWGRLIEQGILVDGDQGFELADPEATTEALEDHGVSVSTDESGPSTTTEIEDDDASWSKWDKLAGVGAVALMFGYWQQDVLNTIGGVIDTVFAPLADLLPFYVVVMVLAVLTGTWSTILQSNLIDKEKMAMYQERMQEIQERRKDAKERGDDEALEEIQKEQMEAMGDNLGMFKLQFRPMVWVMLLTIPVFLWMYWKLGIRGGTQHGDFQSLVLPLYGEATWKTGVLGPLQTWIVWYFLCSMAFGQIIRKALNMQISPSTS